MTEREFLEMVAQNQGCNADDLKMLDLYSVFPAFRNAPRYQWHFRNREDAIAFSNRLGCTGVEMEKIVVHKNDVQTIFDTPGSVTIPNYYAN